MNHTLALWVSVFLLLGNAFFVGAEFAAMAARRSTLEPLAAAGSTRARMVLDALERLGSMLATAQLGITVCSVGLGALAEAALHEMLEDVLHAWHLDQWLSDAWLGPISLSGWLVRVARMDGRRVDRLRFIPVPDESPTAEGGSDASEVRA